MLPIKSADSGVSKTELIYPDSKTYPLTDKTTVLSIRDLDSVNFLKL